jgi:hypothetical protein
LAAYSIAFMARQMLALHATLVVLLRQHVQLAVMAIRANTVASMARYWEVILVPMKSVRL